MGAMIAVTCPDRGEESLRGVPGTWRLFAAGTNRRHQRPVTAAATRPKKRGTAQETRHGPRNAARPKKQGRHGSDQGAAHP